uniref:MULE transposase domain-containing protein n=2 Tax=Cacopsylla melanoneura TaxID=428564 RepID=A0A8D9BAW8_9HEMI
MTPFQEQMLKKLGGQKVCIDGTHGLNNYDFILHSILCVNEFGNGIPVAFMFSNRKDTSCFELFFKKVKERVGILKPEVFMSDDDPAYYNAWTSVMGPAQNQLLCAWHVIQNFKKNIRNKVHAKPQNEKEKILEKCVSLMGEQEEENFQRSAKLLLEELVEDPDTRELGDYLEKYYMKRANVWALCYRKHLGINTNMYLEALHKKIKYSYLNGKKVRRLDLAINVLMKITRDIVFERITKVAENVETTKMKISLSHVASETIDHCDIQFKTNSSWRVNSSTSGNYCKVTRSKTKCPVEYCPLSCTECKICVHSYECTCMDSVLYFNICKHIHACVTYAKEDGSIVVPTQDIQESLMFECLVNSTSISNSVKVVKPQEEAHADLVAKLEEALANLKTNQYDAEEYVKMTTLTDNLLLIQRKGSFQETSAINTKSFVEKQRFYSTKKKHGTKLDVSSPSCMDKK